MKFLSAYYFRAHMYTIVPRHVREDMEWMADIGTNAVVIGVLEQDLTAGVENIQLIAAEAQRAGMQLFITPSRWGSLVAGCPKVPSIFSSSSPEVWALRANGKPPTSFGPVASVHHQATFEFFVSSLERVLSIAPIEGIIWDELKVLQQRDYSAAARAALKGKDIDNCDVHTDAQADFFERVNSEVLKMKPELDISMFVTGDMKGYPVERCARISNLHAFGLDGRPYRMADGGTNDSDGTAAFKLLCDHGPYFINTAHQADKWAFMLIENHAMSSKDIQLMDKRLPEVLGLGAEHICYYYYPRSVSEPDRAMEVLARHLKAR